MPALQLSFVYTHGSADKTSNPLSVVNSHIATYTHRKRRQGGFADQRSTTVQIQAKNTQKACKSPPPQVTASDITFIHCTFPPSIERAPSHGSVSSGSSTDDRVDWGCDGSSHFGRADLGSAQEYEIQENQDNAGFPPYGSAEDLPDDTFLFDLPTSSQEPQDFSPSSSLWFSSSRIGWLDPFNNFPIKLARQDYFFLNHYKFVIPSKIFGVNKSDTYSIQKNVFFPIAMREKTWFFQLLAFASGDCDRRLGLKEESPTTSRYLCASLRSINEQIVDPRTCYSDEMAAAISSAAYIEHYAGRRIAFDAHVRALARILRFRKASFVRVDPDIDAVTVVHLVAYCKTFVETLTDIPGQVSSQTSTELQDMQEVTLDVVESTSVMQKLALWHADRHRSRSYSYRSSEDTAADVKLNKRLQILFAPVSILMSLLRHPERVESPIALVKDAEEGYRLYVICYLLLVLWDCRDHPRKCLGIFSALETAMIEQKITTYTISRVIWILLKDHGDDAICRRWTAFSMLKTLYVMGSRRDQTAVFLFNILQDMGPR